MTEQMYVNIIKKNRCTEQIVIYVLVLNMFEPQRCRKMRNLRQRAGDKILQTQDISRLFVVSRKNRRDFYEWGKK